MDLRLIESQTPRKRTDELVILLSCGSSPICTQSRSRRIGNERAADTLRLNRQLFNLAGEPIYHELRAAA